MRDLLVGTLCLTLAVLPGDLVPVGGTQDTVRIRADSVGPRVFLMEGPAMERLRSLPSDDQRFAPAMARLRRAADAALRAGPFSVTAKTKTPPDGSRHDYMSIGPYWWPNADTPDGLPYVRRDGEVNPERSGPEFDAVRRERMTYAVRTLALAWYYTRHEAYCGRAALLLRTWFLDPETRMTPHLRYAQAIPGRTEGRGIGIIDTAEWVYLVDAAGLLEGCSQWTGEDQGGLRRWFAAYLDWLKSSENGQDEQGHPNNHGTWYDAQVVAYALFTGQPSIARQQYEEWTLGRIEAHFANDGSQPLELDRTRSWHYSHYNLRAYFILARLAEHVGLDLWSHQTQNGAGLCRGLDYILPAAVGEVPWPHGELRSIRSAQLGLEVLPLAIRTYGEARYREAYQKIESTARSQPARLVFPSFVLPTGQSTRPCAA